jgi:hypothetical protein
MASLALAIGVCCGPASAAADSPSALHPDEVPDVLIRRNQTTVPRVGGPAEDFSRHCQGCHGHRGVSVQEVPQLRDRVGYFTHTPDGRAYLVQVPNVLQAHLPDARLAALLNWMLQEFSAGQLAPGFVPYTEAEIRVLRAHRLDSVVARRREVVEGLVRAGVIPGEQTLAFSLEPGRY